MVTTWSLTDSFIRALNDRDLAFAEVVRKKLELMRVELLGEKPTPVERVLVERVVACWLQVQDAELRAAQAQTGTLRQAEFHQHRMGAANRRFLAAVKALAQVRKLAVPVLQVNIAKKQVNVAAPTAVVADAPNGAVPLNSTDANSGRRPCRSSMRVPEALVPLAHGLPP